MEISVFRVCESHRWSKGSGCRVLVVIALFAQLERRMRGTAGLGARRADIAKLYNDSICRGSLLPAAYSQKRRAVCLTPPLVMRSMPRRADKAESFPKNLRSPKSTTTSNPKASTLNAY